MPKLGAEYKDKVTGFTGIATGHCQYLSGCNQTLLVPKIGNDGAYRDGQWFDDQRLENTGTDAIVLDNGDTPGCDKCAPIR